MPYHRAAWPFPGPPPKRPAKPNLPIIVDGFPPIEFGVAHSARVAVIQLWSGIREEFISKNGFHTGLRAGLCTFTGTDCAAIGKNTLAGVSLYPIQVIPDHPGHSAPAWRPGAALGEFDVLQRQAAH